MPIEPIVPRRLYRQVADQLRQLVDNGEYAVGDRLPPERELAEQMGISRPTIREALIALEVEGRVSIRVGSGVYVTEPSRPSAAPLLDDGPFEILRARELVEGAVAEEAARRASPSTVAALDDVLARMGRLANPSPKTLELDREFHKRVAAISGNDVLVRLIDDLFDMRMRPYFMRLSSYFEDRTTWQAALQEHRAVRDAVAAGDPETAKDAMRTHLRLSQQRFSRNFEEQIVAREGQGANEQTAGGSNSTISR